MDWTLLFAQIESLEGIAPDSRLIDEMERCQGTPRPIDFYTPSFKSFSTSEISSCGRSAWPAVSITGPDCKLQCDHCKAKILDPMIPARTPDELWRVANQQIERGARGMLLTGGSNQRNEVEYDPFYPVIRRIKDAFPEFRIALHTALVEREAAQSMADSGIDAAMMDVIGAQETITQVYHLKRSVDDFERTLENLVATRLKVVPHIVLGLHYGGLLGERRALEMVQRHRPAALVLVVVMPFYAPSHRPFGVPASAEIGRFFLDARQALPDIPLLLGCARPAGRAKAEIDAYAVMAGLDGIAHPAEGMVELASLLGRQARVAATCCSMVAGGDLLDFLPLSPEASATHPPLWKRGAGGDFSGEGNRGIAKIPPTPLSKRGETHGRQPFPHKSTCVDADAHEGSMGMSVTGNGPDLASR